MKNISDFNNAHKKCKGPARDLAIRDALALFPEKIPDLLRRPPIGAANARFALEIVAEAPRTPELCRVAVMKAGAAKAVRAVATAVLQDYDEETIVASARWWIRLPHVAPNDTVKAIDAIASWSSEALSTRLYHVLEHQAAVKARAHAEAKLVERGEAPERPWSAWRIHDKAKSFVLGFGWPDSRDGAPHLDIPPNRAFKPSGGLIWFEARWQVDDRRCVLGHMRHHDVTIGFENIASPRLTRWDEGETSTLGAMDEKLRSRTAIIERAAPDASVVSVRVQPRSDQQASAAAILETHLDADVARDLRSPRLGAIARAVAEPLEAALQMDGIFSYMGPASPPVRYTVAVGEGADPEEVASVVRRQLGADPSGDLAFEGASRESAFAVSTALREAGFEVTIGHA